MVLVKMEISEVVETFVALPEYQHFKNADLSTDWEFLREVQDGIEPKIALPLLELPIGSCPHCRSAGTVGFKCQQCGECGYRLLYKEGPIGDLEGICSILLAEREMKKIYMIRPLHPVLDEKKKEKIKINDADWKFVNNAINMAYIMRDEPYGGFSRNYYMRDKDFDPANVPWFFVTKERQERWEANGFEMEMQFS